MRLGTKQTIRIRASTFGRRKLSGFLLFCLIAALISAGGLYFLKVVNPLLITQTKNKAAVMAEQAIHRAVNQMFQNAKADDFLSISMLNDGSVSLASADMVKLNQLKAKASIAIQKEIDALQQTTISIPLGSVSGCSLLSGLGPYLPVDLMPYGRTTVDFVSRFTEAGINQTKLEISLKANCFMGFVLPTTRQSAQVETEVPLVQTVFVGKVPDNYVNIDRMGEDFEGDVLDIVG